MLAELGLTTTVALALALTGGPASADDLIRLSCKGDLLTTRDGAAEVTPTTINLAVNVPSGTVEFEGYWGCLANLGRAKSKWSCAGALPVRVTDSEYLYLSRSEDGEFEGRTSFSLDRYSSRLSIDSVGIAKPEAGAAWRQANISGRFECLPRKRAF